MADREALGRTPIQARERTLQIECSSCGAQPGTPCKTRQGTLSVWPHFPRSEAARLAGKPAAAVPAPVDLDAARRLLEEALHLRMNGERAPGGNETWRDWDVRTEAFLRSFPVRRNDGNG